MDRVWARPSIKDQSGEGKAGPRACQGRGGRVACPLSMAAPRLTMTVEARVGGKLAQLGSRSLGFAKKMAGSVFITCKRHLKPAEPGILCRRPLEGAEHLQRKKGWFRVRSKRLTGCLFTLP